MVPVQFVPTLIAALQEHMRIYSESTGATWDTKGPVLRHESPEIEWQSIDEVFVGLAGVETVERIQQGVKDLGFDVSVGLARSKLVARIASKLGRPRGVVHVLDGYEARFLSPLKIEMLPGIDPALAGRLRAAGIRRLGQIAKLSEPQLSLLAGRAGAALARHAAGIDASRIRRTAMPPRGSTKSSWRPRAPTSRRSMPRFERRSSASAASYARAMCSRARSRSGCASPTAGSTPGRRRWPSRPRWTKRSWPVRSISCRGSGPVSGWFGRSASPARASSPAPAAEDSFPSRCHWRPANQTAKLHV